jgi:hypothetical protein
MNGFLQALFFVLGIALMITGLGAAQYGLVLYGDRSSQEISCVVNNQPVCTTEYSQNFLFTYIPEFTLFSAVLQYAFSSLDYYCYCARQEKITDTAGRLLSSVLQTSATMSPRSLSLS